jgi:hypothetical protein
MEAAERERRVRTFVDEVWNGKHYEAAADLYGENYVNMFGGRSLGQSRADPPLPPGVS